MSDMSKLSDDDVLNLRVTAEVLGRAGDNDDLTQEVAPKGLRFLRRVKRLDSNVADAVANHFGGLAKMQRATLDDLMSVEGVDEAMARSVRDTLTRITESTILDQY